jgi:glycopeptide antibiotics resistance protein
MKLSKRTLTWLIIIYVLTIMALSAAMINTKAALNRTYVLSLRLDYLLHALQFVPWIILIRWRWKEKRGVGFFMLAFGTGLLLAVISEGVQFVLPYRSFNVFDLVANCTGLVFGGIISIGRKGNRLWARG